MTISELLNRLLTDDTHLIVSTVPGNVRVELAREEGPLRALSYGVGCNLHDALISLERCVNKGRVGNHVGGE